MKRAALAVLVFTLFAGVSRGQVSTATISGTVSDSTGARIAAIEGSGPE